MSGDSVMEARWPSDICSTPARVTCRVSPRVVTRLTSLEARDDLAGAEGEGEGNSELSGGLDEVTVVQEQRVLCRHPLASAGEGLAITLEL